jgi:Rieske Fe-S protein
MIYDMSEEKEMTESRRSFLVKLSFGLGGLAAFAVSIPVLGSLLAPLLEKKQQKWRKVGVLSDFAVGSTNLVKFENADPVPWAGTTAKSAAWLRRDTETSFVAFSVNCAHLGCPVRWEQSAELFMCPCHGGVYYKDGSWASGPPPRGLTKYQVRVNNQDVEIKTAPVPLTQRLSAEKS